MGKRYDEQVTPQNTPHFLERKILFLAAMAILVLNLVLTAQFLCEETLEFMICALFFAGFAVVQCLDDRRKLWTWGYVILWIVFALGVSGFLFIWYHAYWWLMVYGFELLVYGILTIRIRKRCIAKPR